MLIKTILKIKKPKIYKLGTTHETKLANQYIMSSGMNCSFYVVYFLGRKTIRFPHNLNQCIDVYV